MSRILVIEDDVLLLEGIADNLRFDQYEVITASDGATGYQLAMTADPDVIILDIMLPKMDGYEVCRKLRGASKTTPILMLTARSEEADCVRGMDLGADDYVTKPFSVLELLARVRALLRRAYPELKLIAELHLGDVFIDFHRYEARRGSQVLELTPKEFGIMRVLGSRAGDVVTREELIERVWCVENITTRTVDNHIASLRSKLEVTPAEPRYLQTVHKVGYKLVVPAAS
jgi:DNA-binding response OmpR family regulator